MIQYNEVGCVQASIWVWTHTLLCMLDPGIPCKKWFPLARCFIFTMCKCDYKSIIQKVPKYYYFCCHNILQQNVSKSHLTHYCSFHIIMHSSVITFMQVLPSVIPIWIMMMMRTAVQAILILKRQLVMQKELKDNSKGMIFFGYVYIV